MASCTTPAPEKKAEPSTPARPVGAAIEIQAPLGLPPVPIPADNPATADSIALGRRLYFDTRLSKDGTVACASCHDPKNGFQDIRPGSVGVGGKQGNRNAPTVINAVYNSVQFWDGRSPSLEDQAGGPIENPIEMAHKADDLVKNLAEDSSYRAEFEKAFGPGPVTFQKIRFAIASFERTVVAGGSPFDKWKYGKDPKAMKPEAIRGFSVFSDAKKGNCAVCHTVEKDHALFTDNKFHNLGVGVDSKGELKDLGRFNVTKMEADKGAFKTPTLRNIATTAPYMHDGSLQTLREVVDFYVGGGNSNPFRDKEIKALEHLTKQERADLVAFMEALTGPLPATTGPPAEGR
ncbi:MAG: c-type cytochrome [Acidobacteria bacterium]|nr:c-type cytochrome [Acidobacteriota bacterium]